MNLPIQGLKLMNKSQPHIARQGAKTQSNLLASVLCAFAPWREPAFIALCLIFALAARSFAVTPAVVQPATNGMSAKRLAHIDAAVEKAIERRETPGAVVLAARRGKVVWRKAYGARVLEPTRLVEQVAAALKGALEQYDASAASS